MFNCVYILRIQNKKIFCVFKGIGRGIAVQLAKCGAKVIALDVSVDQLSN